MKALKIVLISLAVLIAVVGCTIIGGYIYVRSVYGIDLFNTANQLKILSEKVDEDKLCPNAFKDEDLVELKDVVNTEIDGLIKVEEGKGYNGYYIDFEALLGESFSKPISLSEKQVGALAQMVFYGKTGGKFKLGEKETNASIAQIDFSEIQEDGSANFNVVCKIDLTPFKENMNGFPYDLFTKYIPDNLYISSTVKINKDSSDGFKYSLSHVGLGLNNLNHKDTEDLFHTLDILLKIGSAENVNMNIGTVATNALIGNIDNVGFAYSLKAVGATAFYFGNIEFEGNAIDFFTVV